MLIWNLFKEKKSRLIIGMYNFQNINFWDMY